MTDQPGKRRPGRPPAGATDIDHVHITSTAIRLLEANGWTRFSMRALARTLQIDPMTLYHYFPSKTALLEAMVTNAFGALDPRRPPFDPAQSLEDRLQHLAGAYLDIVLRTPELVGELISGRLNAAEPVTRFDALFQQAVSDLPLADAWRQHAAHLLVDYLHGFALGADASANTSWMQGVTIIVRGIEAVATDGTDSE